MLHIYLQFGLGESCRHVSELSLISSGLRAPASIYQHVIVTAAAVARALEAWSGHAASPFSRPGGSTCVEISPRSSVAVRRGAFSESGCLARLLSLPPQGQDQLSGTWSPACGADCPVRSAISELAANSYRWLLALRRLNGPETGTLTEAVCLSLRRLGV